ncbi:transporter, MotA/TolQ/ExbB proton channel family protein [Verrucomicrobiia bacterium DG1235]|nr:transporter, MotA/TolQ/ExbB proton channel family protein [Verrucomicrobiae bacterium DG1235]
MFQELADEVVRIWVAGGALMIPLAMLGLVIYFALFEIIVYFGLNDYYNSDPDEWKHWVDEPDDAKGALGDIIQYAQHEVHSMDDVRDRMDEIRSSHLSRINSRIRFAAILVGTAPLTGLLGTVTGMLSTFAGLSNSAAGNTVDLVAGGISEALITTQTGLVLAIPGYIMLNIVKRRRDQMDAFCTQVEILTLKRFEKGKIAS